MKNQTQKTAPASPKKRGKKSKRQATAPLLTVTLDASASAAVRCFAAEFGEDVRDVAGGSILDTLPQALEEWEHTKQRRATGKGAVLDYWQGTAEAVRAARGRRIGRKAGKEAA